MTQRLPWLRSARTEEDLWAIVETLREGTTWIQLKTGTCVHMLCVENQIWCVVFNTVCANARTNRIPLLCLHATLRIDALHHGASNGM